MARALILVDIQNDFMPGGPLGVPGGDEVVPIANALIPRFELVLATRDHHPPDHRSFASMHPGRSVGDRIDLHGVDQILWPDHCVRGTLGSELVADLDRARIDRVFPKGQDRELDSYSGFFDNARRHDTGLDDWLKGRGVSEVFIAGVATDYCVAATALDAASLGYRTTLVEDGCRGVDLVPGDVDRALERLVAAGVDVRRESELRQTTH